MYTMAGLEFWGQVNLLKGGLVFADLLNTVSETYAQEIQTAEFGAGLDGVLRDRSRDLFGILNGVDYSVWEPAHDPLIPARYTPDDLSGKRACKDRLQDEFGLAADPDIPLIGMVTRLADQKGLDLVAGILDTLFAAGAQLIVLGTGDPRYERMFSETARRHPRQSGVRIGFDNALAHRIEAGADMFLMPSRFEPSGLNQLYSLKYGTVPIVRDTGGLHDTVADGVTGFRFKEYAASAFLAAVRRALTLYRQSPAEWLKMTRAGMKQDWSWENSARKYEA